MSPERSVGGFQVQNPGRFTVPQSGEAAANVLRKSCVSVIL